MCGFCAPPPLMRLLCSFVIDHFSGLLLLTLAPQHFEYFLKENREIERQQGNRIESHSRSRIKLTVKSRSQFKERSAATNVEIEMSMPSDATNPNIRTSMGSASFAPEKDALVWKMKSFPGGMVDRNTCSEQSLVYLASQVKRHFLKVKLLYE